MKKFLSLMLALTMCLSLTAHAFAAGAGNNAQTLLRDMAYYGDVSRCKMSAEQARAYAEQIRRLNRQQREIAKRNDYAEYARNYDFESYAALFDAGNGDPYLLFACGLGFVRFDFYGISDDVTEIGIYEYKNNATTEVILDDYYKYYQIYPSHIEIYSIGLGETCSVYPFQNGEISKAAASSYVRFGTDEAYYVGGKPVDYNAFRAVTYSEDMLCGVVCDTRTNC